MKYLSLIIGLLAASFQSNAQDLLAQAKSGDNWGYINTKGEFVIDAQYKNCHAFSEGFAPIYDKKAKTFYFIKPDGSKLDTEIDKFKLKNIFGFGTKGFEDGLVPVQVGKQWGYLNTSGKLLVPAKFDKAQEFNSGFGVTESSNRFYIISKDGSEKQVDISGLEDVKRFSEGLAPYRVNGQWGFINTEGAVVIEAQYKGIGYLSEGLAWVKNEAGQVGFIDSKGNVKIDLQFQAAKEFSEGLARVKKNDAWLFVDLSGKEITSVGADTYGNFSNGLAYAKKNDVVGFVGKDGNWVIDAKFEKVRDFKNGYAAVRKGENWGFIDKTGNWVIEPTFAGVKDFEKVK